MGINARLRYAISWLLIKVLMTVLGWIATALIWVNVGIAMFALWFSPEMQQREAKRILESLDE